MAGKKGSRKAKRSKAKRAKKSGGMTKKQRRRAAGLKAARTRKRNANARSRAAKKGARKARRKGSRKGKRRAAEAMEKPRKKKGKKGGKRKSGKKGKRRGKRQDLATQLTNAKMRIATVEQRYADKHRALQDSILKAAGLEKERLRKRLLSLEAERGKELARKNKQIAVLQAAEKGKRRKGRKGKGRRGAKRNPIGSGGAHEWGATALGIFTGLVLTIGPYRVLRSHALTPVAGGQGGSGGIDAPKQGDVPNLLAPQQAFWSNLKWRGLIAIVTVGAVDIALPAVLAAYSDSDFWKTFNQTWMATGIALSGAKVVTDVAAVSLKSTLIGQRMFATENTARDVRAQSVNAQLPAISVAPGLGMPGLTGYGKAKCTKNLGAGAACCCDECGGARGKTVVKGAAPGTGEPITGTTPIPAAPGTPAAPPISEVNPANPGGGLPLGGPTRYSGAGGNVTPINKFAIHSRFDGSALRK